MKKICFGPALVHLQLHTMVVAPSGASPGCQLNLSHAIWGLCIVVLSRCCSIAAMLCNKATAGFGTLTAYQPIRMAELHD